MIGIMLQAMAVGGATLSCLGPFSGNECYLQLLRKVVEHKTHQIIRIQVSVKCNNTLLLCGDTLNFPKKCMPVEIPAQRETSLRIYYKIKE